MDKHDILIVSKSDDNSIYVTTKGDIFEIAAAIKAITGGIVRNSHSIIICGSCNERCLQRFT